MGLICASVPALQPLFKSTFRGWSSLKRSQDDSSGRMNSGGGVFYSRGTNNLRRLSSGMGDVTEGSSKKHGTRVTHTPAKWCSESEENIFLGGIETQLSSQQSKQQGQGHMCDD